jgi:hypothetical protein
MKALIALSKSELIEIGNLVVKSDVKTLREIIDDENSSSIHAMVARLAIRVIDYGDPSAFDALLNRLIGKVKDEVHQTNTFAPPAKVIVTLPDNGRSLPPSKDTVPAEIIDAEVSETNEIDLEADYGF